MQMTIDEAVDQATKFTEGATFHAGSTGWKAVMAVLLAEVKRSCVTDEPCRCPACKAAEEVNEISSLEIEEPQGPLPPAILAGELDHLAGEMIDKAGEIEIYSISHAHHADELRGAAKQLVGWAKEIREESNGEM